MEKELQIMQQIYENEELQKLDHSAKQRVLDWLMRKLNDDSFKNQYPGPGPLEPLCKYVPPATT